MNNNTAKKSAAASRSGSLYIIIGAAFWGLIGIFVRNIRAVGFSSLQIVALRTLGASAILLVWLLLRSRDQLKIRLRDLWVFLGTGIGSMVFFNCCYFGCMDRTSLAVAAALLYTSPAFVGILARIFLHEKLGRRGLLAVCVAVLGCFFTSGMVSSLIGSLFSSGTVSAAAGSSISSGAASAGISLDAIGLLLGLGSGLGYALYSIFGKFAIARGYSGVTITVYTFLFAAICTFPALLTGNIHAAAALNPLFLLSLAGLLLISTIIAYILYNRGLARVSAGTASVLACIEPVVAALVSVFIFHEAMNAETLIGILCILASTVILA